MDFVTLVADLSGLRVDAVLATEAACYCDQEAIDIGLADERVNGHEAISIFANHLSTQGRVISQFGVIIIKDNETVQAQAPSTAAVLGAVVPVVAATAPAVQSRADESSRVPGF